MDLRKFADTFGGIPLFTILIVYFFQYCHFGHFKANITYKSEDGTCALVLATNKDGSVLTSSGEARVVSTLVNPNAERSIDEIKDGCGLLSWLHDSSKGGKRCDSQTENECPFELFVIYNKTQKTFRTYSINKKKRIWGGWPIYKMMDDLLVTARNKLLRFFGGDVNKNDPIGIELPPLIIEKAMLRREKVMPHQL